MKSNVLTSKSPHLDLHGETTAFLPVLVDEFINDNIKLKNKYIVVVHGYNSSILKKELQVYLKKDTRVKNFYIDPFNIGQTIIELDI